MVCWKEYWLIADLGAHCVPPLVIYDIKYITKPLYVPFSLLQSEYESIRCYHLTSQVAEDNEVMHKTDLSTRQMKG